MIRFELGAARIGAAIFGVLVLGACAAKAPPPPPPPPPPIEIVPYRPLPPGSATYIMTIPGRGVDGQRITVLKGLNDDQRQWYFRSAWNVAALNCVGPEFQPILDGYGAYLKGNAKVLKAVNQRIEKSYASQYKTRGEAIAAREKLMTTVYNYFALPPARAEFCQTAMRVAGLAAMTPKPDAATLAGNFSLWEAPFENFFVAYEQYQRDSAAWDARYGARYGASQPGYLAVQAARASSVPQIGLSNPASTTLQPITQAGVVIDQDTGAKIPVVPVQQTQQAVPVVQPVPQSLPKPK